MNFDKEKIEQKILFMERNLSKLKKLRERGFYRRF